ncbi:MAG: hypothetical protein NXI31_21690 [bacterium]|nr:hypothetical protein [bacterium]
MKTLTAATLAFLFAGCVTRGLEPIVLEGPELHPSLVTRKLPDVLGLHVDRKVLRGNPTRSSAPDFVEHITRASSQGRLSNQGIREALYALYRAEKDVGFYGLETAAIEDADRLEGIVRDIWAMNASLDRAKVHRRGKVIVIVWTDGVAPDCWAAVNRCIAERL